MKHHLPQLLREDFEIGHSLDPGALPGFWPLDPYYLQKCGIAGAGFKGVEGAGGRQRRLGNFRVLTPGDLLYPDTSSAPGDVVVIVALLLVLYSLTPLAIAVASLLLYCVSLFNSSHAPE
jgi:hypothetical protein